EIMSILQQSHFSSAFDTNSIAMAAAVATLERLKRGDVIPHLWQLGQAFLDGLNQLAHDSGVEAQAVGAAPMPYLIFTYDSGPTFAQTGQIGTPATSQAGSRNEKAWRAFYTETTRGGLLLHPNHQWFV